MRRIQLVLAMATALVAARCAGGSDVPPVVVHSIERTATPTNSAPPPTALPTTPTPAEATATPQVVTGSATPSLLDERELYALALAARANGDPLAAAEAFARVDAAGGVLASIARLRSAQALAAAGRDHAAADAFERTLADDRLPGVVRVPARLDAAETLARLTRHDEALALFDAVALDPDATQEEAADARWRGARLRRDRDDPAWTDDARGALVAAPWSTFAVSALDSLERAGRDVAPLTAGYVRYRAHDDEAAAAAYLAVVDGDFDAAEQAVAWFFLGAIAERAGEVGLATDRYGRSLALDASGWLADDARWWRGRLFESSGMLREAAGEYDSLAAAFPASPFTTDASLRGALALYAAGDRVEAESRLRRLATTMDGPEAAGAARWLAALGAGGPGRAHRGGPRSDLASRPPGRCGQRRGGAAATGDTSRGTAVCRHQRSRLGRGRAVDDRDFRRPARDCAPGGPALDGGGVRPGRRG